jgi:hypothetical protein
VLSRASRYPNGQRFLLELLTFPGLVKPAHAHVAINALHDSVMWTHLNCGPEATLHTAERVCSRVWWQRGRELLPALRWHECIGQRRV